MVLNKGERGICKTGKVRYRGRNDAEIDMIRINTKRPFQLKKLKKAHYCHVCDGYHLTSKR